jgi:hypothetical protein
MLGIINIFFSTDIGIFANLARFIPVFLVLPKT